VLDGDLLIGGVKIERTMVVQLNDEERAEANRLRQPEHLREKLGRTPLVAAPDDGVVQLHAHDRISS
jgi:hypothetical protein